jgi:thiol peroxidase
MSTVTWKGNPVHTSGELPAKGTQAPDFRLTRGNMEDVSLRSFVGQRKILTVNASFDTSVCQATARRFNEQAARLKNTVVLAISADLPFAQNRFCEAEGLSNVIPLSQMRNRDFGRDYGLLMVDGPMEGLLTRAVIVLDERDRVLHTELVPEGTTEPDYASALGALGA